MPELPLVARTVDIMKLHSMSTDILKNVGRVGAGTLALLVVAGSGFAQYNAAPPNQPPAQYPAGPSAVAGSDAEAPVDEPGRAVARLGILNGDASIRRGDSSEWVAAAINAPLMSGDQISVGVGSRAEIQLDAAHFLRIAGDTELRLADLENGHFQIQIAHGLVTWRVLRDSQSQAEISTPLVAVHPGRLSVVRVDVSVDGSSHITVRRGEAEVSTQAGTERVRENNTMDVRGQMNDPEFQVVAAAARDEWDSWSDQRDSYLSRAQSPRYVQQEVSGAEDLDAYGRWSYDSAYGWVWMPTVASSWAPYRDGQWVWEDYYGWTWVDYSPWGWAPFHYGSWYMREGFGWAWFPGARTGRAWWRPAMVGFFGWGGVGVGFGFGNIGWVPLAPFEVFHPWYGRGGFGHGFNVERNANIGRSFRNAGVANGVTGLAAVDFQKGNFRNMGAVNRTNLQQASLVRGGVPVSPTNSNLGFTNRPAAVQPSRGGIANGQRFYGSATNAPARTPFVQQQATLRSAMNGQPTAQGPGAGQSRPVGSNPGNAAGSWQRFQGVTPGPNAQAPNAGGAHNRSAGPAANAGQGGNAAPGFSRFGGNSNGEPQGGQYPQQQRPQGGQYPQQYPQQQQQQQQPRQYQVAPSIIRQRPESAPPAYREAPPAYRQAPQTYQAPESRPQQARPQQAPAPQQGGGNYGGRSYAAPAQTPAQRNAAPAGGNRQSTEQRGGRR